MENHIFFFQTPWKDGLSKKIALEYNLSCVIGKDDIFFSRKYDLFSLGRKWNTWKHDASSPSEEKQET